MIGPVRERPVLRTGTSALTDGLSAGV